MPFKTKKPALIFIIYWFLLAYIIAALIFWFLALNIQNDKMLLYKQEQLKTEDTSYATSLAGIKQENKRKKMQYAGEGATFLLLIIAGAIFVYRSVKNQLAISKQQQNFMIAITHELKTPVAISKLNLETLQKRKLEPPQQQRLMQNTLQEINRLDTLCNNMLVSSQIEAGGYRMVEEKINLSMLCFTIAEEFSQRFADRKINCEINETDIFIEADPVLIQIVISNLVENALKYSPKESPVEIKVDTIKKFATLQVIDNGPGIPEPERKKIFRKFYRLGNDATRKAKGTGLGLYLSEKIINAHNGTILNKDNPAGGSIFMVNIPLA
ncbi:MAG: ATP-binding protein [Ferruginibacter sp.]